MNNAWDAVEYKAEIDYWKEKYEMEKSKNLELAKALMTYGQHRNDSMWEPNSIVPHLQAQWMEEKLTRYTKQLQWLYEHYPEQNGEWGKDTQWFVYFYNDDEEWDTSADSDSPTLNLIYMSLGAAQHLRYDLNSGKVRF